MSEDQGEQIQERVPLLVVLHGVNLNLLGERPATHYGQLTLRELEERVRCRAAVEGWRCLCHQTNHEGEFVELIHRHRRATAMIVNPGAWTHYSYAIRDALELVAGPVAEVHLSNIYEREEWRGRSVIAEVASWRVAGKGLEGYLEAVAALASLVAVRAGRLSGGDLGQQGSDRELAGNER